MSKRKVPLDGELKQLYLIKKLSSVQISEMCGATRQSVCRRLRAMDIEIRNVFIGDKHPNWKGGRVNKGGGYKGLWIPSHPRADKKGYVYEHIIVMENSLGKPIEAGSVIHHINGDKKDNRMENLYLCIPSEHEKAHRSFEKLMKVLLDEGTTKFENGEYKISNE